MNVFAQITEYMATNPPGWCTEDKAHILASIVCALRPAVSVEIGVFGGRSAIPIALAHKALGYGTLFAIDPWDKNASVIGYEGEDRKWWDGLDHEIIFQEFMRSVKAYELESVLRVIRNKSDEVSPPTNVGLLHLDGQHTEQAVRDVKRYAPEVVQGGITVLDDLDWIGGGVERAARLLESMGFMEIYRLETGAAFRRL